MSTFKQSNELCEEIDIDEDEDELEEGTIANKTWYYTKAFGRNLAVSGYAGARRYLTKRHADRYWFR